MPFESIDFVWLGCAAACVSGAAMAAGLTMGLLSLDTLKLKIKTMTGSEEEKMYANAILPLLDDHHFLLCSLLIFNAAANEALPIFLDELLPSWGAILVSVTLVLIFGEVVPTALFTGAQQLKIAYKFSSVVRAIQFVFYPVAKPMAAALDWGLGSDHDKDEMYTRDEIGAMVRILRSKGADMQQRESRANSPRTGTGTVARDMNVVVSSTSAPLHEIVPEKMEGAVLQQINNMGQRRNPSSNTSQATTASEVPVDENTDDDEAPLSMSEVNVITGVLGLAKLTISDVLVPLENVNMLSSSQIFDVQTVNAVCNVGHSRLPVYFERDVNHIVGVFLVKRLISINPEKKIQLCQMGALKKPLVVGSNQSLLDVLTIFQSGQSHIGLVSHNPTQLRMYMEKNESPSADCAPLGIVTIEDIFEAMIQSKIYDEADVDLNVKRRKEGQAALKQMNKKVSSTSSLNTLLTTQSSIATLQAPGGTKDPSFVMPYKQQAAAAAASKQILSAMDKDEEIDDDATTATTHTLDTFSSHTTQSSTGTYTSLMSSSHKTGHNNNFVSSVVVGTDTDKEDHTKNEAGMDAAILAGEERASKASNSDAHGARTAENTAANKKIGEGAATDLDYMEAARKLPNEQKKPSLLRSLSSKVSGFFGSGVDNNKELNKKLLDAQNCKTVVGIDDYREPPKLSKARTTGSIEDNKTRTATHSDESRSLQKTNKYQLENVDGTWQYKNTDMDDKRSFYRKFDKVFDDMGVPLIQDPSADTLTGKDSAKTNTTTNKARGGPSTASHVGRFAANEKTSLKPTMLAKYVKTRRYSIDEC